MTYPSGNFAGVPSAYQGNLTFVPSALYQGGGYYAAYARGRKFSFAELEKLWDDAGGDPKLQGLMAAIGENESGGYVGAWNSTGATSIWQIEYPGSSPAGVSRQQLFGAEANAKAAVDLSGNTIQGIQQNWAGDPALAPGAHIPNVPPAKSVSGTGPPTGPIQANTDSFTGPFAKLFTSPTDIIERIGLVLFGGFLVIIGFVILGSSPTQKAARALGITGGKSGPSPLSSEDQADKERRQQLAERSAAIGERRVAVSESREARIGRSRVHGGRTGGREPNPEPIHG